MTKEALKLALEALEVANSCVDGYYIPKGRTQLPEIELAITAIKETLAQPEQEPVAAGWLRIVQGHTGFVAAETEWGAEKPEKAGMWIPLYTTPPQRTLVGLTDSEIGTIAYNVNPLDGIRQFSRAIEAKLKEKNCG